MAKKTASRVKDRHEDIRVYWTTDYSQFGHLESNRNVSTEHVKKLTKKIKEQGFNRNFAIKVIEKDGQYFITSGQHRFEAAQEAEVELAYSIIPPEEQDESLLVDHSGVQQKQWNADAILNYYVHSNKRNKSYKRFDSFVKSVDFPTGICLTLITGLDVETGRPLVKDHSSLFRDGDLEVSKSRIVEAEGIADTITSIIDSDDAYKRFSKNAAFIKALYLLTSHDNFNVKQLEKALRTSPRGFVIQPKWGETLQAMTDVYNNKLKSKKINFPKIFEPIEKLRRKNRFTS